MKLICPKNGEHKLFLRESYDENGAKFYLHDLRPPAEDQGQEGQQGQQEQPK